MPKKTSKLITTEIKPSLISEADFNDTIARNRAMSMIDPNRIPPTPEGFVATDSTIRVRRLRRLSDEHRSEAHDALVEASKLDLTAVLGKRAPDSARALTLAERMSQSGMVAARAERLARYANEMDEIALNDALVFLEALFSEYEHEAKHDPNVAQHFPAMIRLFESRSAAIAKGIARSVAERATSDEESQSAE